MPTTTPSPTKLKIPEIPESAFINAAKNFLNSKPHGKILPVHEPYSEKFDTSNWNEIDQHVSETLVDGLPENEYKLFTNSGEEKHFMTASYMKHRSVSSSASSSTSSSNSLTSIYYDLFNNDKFRQKWNKKLIQADMIQQGAPGVESNNNATGDYSSSCLDNKKIQPNFGPYPGSPSNPNLYYEVEKGNSMSPDKDRIVLSGHIFYKFKKDPSDQNEKEKIMMVVISYSDDEEIASVAELRDEYRKRSHGTSSGDADESKKTKKQSVYYLVQIIAESDQPNTIDIYQASVMKMPVNIWDWITNKLVKKIVSLVNGNIFKVADGLVDGSDDSYKSSGIFEKLKRESIKCVSL